MAKSLNETVPEASEEIADRLEELIGNTAIELATTVRGASVDQI